MPQDSATDNPASPCPGPCDVAIPLVYPTQAITIPASEVENQVPFDINVRESLEATFTQPDSDPPLSIQRWVGNNAKVLGLGHAGIAIVNGVTGAVEYWEYGRYDAANFGQVRKVGAVSSVTMSFEPGTGNPVPASLNALASALTRTNGGPYAVEGVYIKLANGAFDTMSTFAQTRRDAVANQSAAAYNVAGNHCFTFAMEVAASAGVRTRAARGAPTLDVQLRGGNMVTRGLIGTFAPEFEVPARQMRAMQGAYQPFNISSGGSVESGFRFPTGLNMR